MIILFEENETEFANLGLGILRDAISCVVKESLNDEFTLSMEYPAKGSNFDKIKENRIIYCKPNPYDNAQAFRINSISKVINGTVTIDAVHISYDTNSIPVKAFSATSLQDVIIKIQNGSVVHNPFILTSDIMYSRTYKTTAPYNLRALMLGDEDSIATKYNAEFKFDNYHIYILAKRGADRGAVVRYGHNMTDINHTQTTDLLYNGVYPYYHTETEKTETTSSDEFKQVYIVGSKPFQDGWLSYTKDGEPYHPMDTSPVQVATEGDYYQKVYCWNEIYNVYQEKVYNEMVSLVQGVIEPTWISIDWSKFPKIVCRANKNGYFKKSTDTDWGTLKGVGDIVFEGSILNTSTMENMVLYYSEVIPTNTTSENTETSEIVDVQLDDPIMWIETDSAKAMKHNRILMLDLTSEFDEAPTKERLKSKAQEYIIKNKIGTIKHSTTLSFVDLSKTSDHSENENLDHVEIGDTVKVIYEDIGVSTSLRVISTEYDAILGRYNSVELGEKEDKMSSSTVQNGDGVSALTNDVGYASVTTVNKLIADTVNANYIQALNAKLSKAQISQLEVERIDVKGIIEASQFTIDSLVAKLLVADNAEIKDTLTAGNIKVAGDISIKSGSIDIYSDEGTEFRVDREGNVTANSMAITGGTLNIGDGMFEVTNDGIMSARAAQIEGTIVANDGQIGGFTISSDQYKQIHYNNLNDSNSVIVSPGIQGELGSVNDTWAFAAGKKFGVTINGKLYAKDAELSGKITANGGKLANFLINENSISTVIDGTNDPYTWHSEGVHGIYLGSNGLKLGDGFKVGVDGTVAINKGSITIKDGDNVNFEVTETGAVTINNGEITLIGKGSSLNPDFHVTSSGELIANNAHINGDITVNHGSITLGEYTGYFEIQLTSDTYKKAEYFIKNENNEYILSTEPFDSTAVYYVNSAKFIVDPLGNAKATSLYLSGGELRFGNGTFAVDNEGRVTASNIKIIGSTYNDNTCSITISDNSGKNIFSVDKNGKLTASDVEITGSGTGSSFKLQDGKLTATGVSIENGTITITKGGIYLGTKDAETNKHKFQVDSSGDLYSISGTIGGFTIDGNSLHAGTISQDNSVMISTGSITSYNIGNSGSINGWAFTAGSKFGVTKDGNLYASDATIAGSLSMSGKINYNIKVAYPDGHSGNLSGSTTANSIISTIGITSTINYKETPQPNGLKYYTRPWGIITEAQYFNYDIDGFGSSGISSIGIKRAPISMIFGAVSDPDTATWAKTGLTLWSNQRLSLTADDNYIINYYIDKWKNGTSYDPYHILEFGNTDIDDFFIYSGNNIKFRPFSFDTSPLSITNFATLTHYYSPYRQEVDSNAIIYIRCGYTEKVGEDQWYEVFTCGSNQKIISATANKMNYGSTASLSGTTGGAQVYFANSKGNTLYVGNDSWAGPISWIAIIMDTSHVA